MSTYKWQFAPCFRRRAFGWRSDTPIRRLREAVREIRQVGRKEPVLAAEGAVILLEKLSPALEHVDGSSGAMSSAVNNAITTLVPVIAAARAEPEQRKRWMERLWQAFEEDEVPWIELLGDYWGELCATPELASHWADELLPGLEDKWSRPADVLAYFRGSSACLSSLLAAARHEELLALLDRAPTRWWHYRRWGVKALVALGRKAEAIRYAEDSRGFNDPAWPIAEACEAILLSSGMVDEAYRRYAIDANQGTTYLATFRAIVRKYPDVAPGQILRDLVASTPGREAKWFAAAKAAGLFDLATELAGQGPADPRTLTRAARDFAETRPEFALAVGLAALHWISQGHGYEITRDDVLEAHAALVLAAPGAGLDAQALDARIRTLYAAPSGEFLRSALDHRPSS